MSDNSSALLAFFHSLGGWGWMILGMILVVIEIFAPSTIVLWFGVSALAVGGIVLIFADIGWQYQLLMFALFSVILLFTARRYLLKYQDKNSDEPSLNQRGTHLIGRHVKIAEKIENGVGKVSVGDSLWLAHADNDIAKGVSVEIIAVEGTALKVKAV